MGGKSGSKKGNYWNEFEKSKAGLGLSSTEISRLYHEKKGSTPSLNAVVQPQQLQNLYREPSTTPLKSIFHWHTATRMNLWACSRAEPSTPVQYSPSPPSTPSRCDSIAPLSQGSFTGMILSPTERAEPSAAVQHLPLPFLTPPQNSFNAFETDFAGGRRDGFN